MFDWFGGKTAYQQIPDMDDEERREDDAHYNPVPTGSSSNQPNGEENMRFRGDKRLIERGGDFHQSTGKIALRKKIKRRYFRALYGVDLFHSLVDAPTTRIIGILMGTYMTIVILFALVYLTISRTLGCNLDIVSFADAFAFSLETMATIGYSTTDIFFDDCPLMLTVLSMQVCVKLIADAVTIGVLYCKLSRPHARASTVIFSEKAVIRRIRGKLYFMFQLCELRKHQLVEAHVRVYVVRNEIDLSACFESDMYNEEEHITNYNTNTNTNHNTTHAHNTHTNTNTNPSTNNKRRASGMYSKHSTSMSTDDGSLDTFSGHTSNKTTTFNAHQYHTLPAHPQHSASTYNLHSLHTSPINSHHTTHTTHHPSTTTFTTQPSQHTTHHNTNTSTSTNTNTTPPPNSVLLTQYTLRSTHRPNYMQTSVMRLNHPNDELGGMLLLMTPQVVVHEIDAGSPLMPPPVWYCNFAYDVSGNPHSMNLSGQTPLGCHQAGDCIRWRPPAYRNFIHYAPVSSSGGNSGVGSGVGSRMGSRGVSAVSSSTNMAGMHHNSIGVGSGTSGGISHVQFQVPAGAAASAEKEAKSKAGSHHHHHKRHKHKRAAHRYNADLPITTTKHTNNNTHNTNTNHNHTHHTADHATLHPLPTPYTTSNTPSEPMWFYDAESLSRIEFPSVVRRIDTDNIATSNDNNPYTNGTVDNSYSSANSNGGGVYSGVSDGECIVDQSAGSGGHTPIRANTSYSSIHDPHDDYSMVELASEHNSPHPHTTHTVHNTHNIPHIHTLPTTPHSSNSHNAHTAHTTLNTHYTPPPADDYANRSMRFRSSGLSSYADLLNTMSPSPMHNNNFKSNFDLSPLRSPQGGAQVAGSGSIGNNLHKSMYNMNRQHFASPVVPTLLSPPVFTNNITTDTNTNTGDADSALHIDVDTSSTGSGSGSSSTNSSNSSNNSSDSNVIPGSKSTQSLTLSPDRSNRNTPTTTTPADTTNNTNTNTTTTNNTNTAHELSRHDSNLDHHYENVRTITDETMLFDDDHVSSGIGSVVGSAVGSAVGSVVHSVADALPTLSPLHTSAPHTPHVLNTVNESGSDSDSGSEGDVSNTHHTLDLPVSTVNNVANNANNNTITTTTTTTPIHTSYKTTTASLLAPLLPPELTPVQTTTTNTTSAPRWTTAEVPKVVYDSVGIVDSAKHRTATKSNVGSITSTNTNNNTNNTPIKTPTTTDTQLPYPAHLSGRKTKKVADNTLPVNINDSGGIATSDGTRGTPSHTTHTTPTNTNYTSNTYTTHPNNHTTHPTHHPTQPSTPDGYTYMHYTWQEEEQSMVQRYLRDRQVEIIVIVEGVDAATGGMVQARHSYTANEIAWDKSFECCVEKDQIDGCTTIDFSRFHALVDVPSDAPFAGVVHSCI